MLKTSVLNSRFVDSENLMRLFRTTSNCLKLGPRKACRGRLPNVPGAGVAKAAGFKMSRSLDKYGLTPATRSGRRTLREAPPPGVLITAVKPGGNGLAALIVPGNCATKPLANVVVAPPGPVGSTHPAAFRH